MVTLSGLLSVLSLSVSFNRVILSLFLFSGYSLGLLSSLSLVFSLVYPMAYPFPALIPYSLFPPFPLVYRRYRYAIRLTRNGDYFV